MEPKKLNGTEMKMIGLEIRTSNQVEIDPARAKIPGVMYKFFEKGEKENIPNQIDSNTWFVIYTNYESDYTGEYSFILSSEVSKLEHIPEGMVGLTIPATEYLVFPVRGNMPETLVKTWGIIWQYFSPSAYIQRGYLADIEKYNKNTPSEVDIYIAIKVI